MKKFETVTEILFHLEEVKSKMDAFKAENPGIKFETYYIRDLQPGLLYELESIDSREIQYNPNLKKLTLSSYGTHGVDVFFISVQVERSAPKLQDFRVSETA